MNQTDEKEREVAFVYVHCRKEMEDIKRKEWVMTIENKIGP